MMNNLFTQNNILSKAMEVATVRNDVMLTNIANVDTPGYKRRSVSFESMFQDALESEKLTGKLNLDNINPQIQVEHGNYSYRLDGNNIDVEKEMTELYKNSLRYDVLTNSVSNNFKRLNLVYTVR